MNSDKEILFMGPQGSGKTLLLKRLQTLTDEKKLTPFDQIPNTNSTNGLETTNFKFRGVNFAFKELGGSSISEWETHAKSAKVIIYVFDAADLTKTATNIVWLHELLTCQSIESKPIMILLSKCDVPDCIRFSVIDEILGFERMLNPQRFKYIETSSVVGVGLSEIFHWISDQMK